MPLGIVALAVAVGGCVIAAGGGYFFGQGIAELVLTIAALVEVGLFINRYFADLGSILTGNSD